MLERLLKYLTAEELAELTGVYVLEKVEPHTLIQVVKAGLADPQLRKQAAGCNILAGRCVDR